MQRLFRIRSAIVLRWKRQSPLREWNLLGAKLILLPLILLTGLLVAMEFNIRQGEFSAPGPFTSELQRGLVLRVPDELPWWQEPLVGDSDDRPSVSRLKFLINGQRLEPAHSQHQAIRQGADGFSHWGDRVIFSLPEGVQNSGETVATLRYSVLPRIWITLMAAALSVMLCLFVFKKPSALVIQASALSLRGAYLILFALCGLGAIASAVYVGVCVYALATGWALPTTALIRLLPIGEWAARNEPYLAYLLLMFAGLGTAATWLNHLAVPNQSWLQRDEQFARRLLTWCLFPIIASAFVMCISASWAGMVRPGDIGNVTIGGLISFSDASDYVAAAYDQIKNGIWPEIALRRPLAAAFRSVLLVLGSFSLQQTLLVQACLVAGATCIATHAIAAWRGVWAGLFFLGLTYIYNRSFAPTTLTEPLGVFWGLLSIPFFVRAFRGRSPKAALAGFALTSIALMTRMGSMFTIPALLVWLVWQFGQGTVAKLRIAAASACILLGVFGLNFFLQGAFGTGSSPATANFSYVFCGLSMGTSWDGCGRKLASEGKPLSGDADSVARQLYAEAWKNLRTNPKPFFGRLGSAIRAFVTGFPDVIWSGYGTSVEQPEWTSRRILTAMVIIGLLYGAARATTVELSFWMLFWGSITASAAVVYLDDGARVLAASHPLMALFFARGMGVQASNPSPVPESRAHTRLERNTAVGLIVTATLFVSIPSGAYHFYSVTSTFGSTASLQSGEAIILGGRRISGFLVIDDGLPLPPDVPSLHLTDFANIVKNSGVEAYQNLIHPVPPPLPFGFIFAPRLERDSKSNRQFIVPAEVLERHNVPAWRLTLRPWGQIGGPYYWFYVTHAEPWT